MQVVSEPKTQFDVSEDPLILLGSTSSCSRQTIPTRPTGQATRNSRYTLRSRLLHSREIHTLRRINLFFFFSFIKSSLKFFYSENFYLQIFGCLEKIICEIIANICDERARWISWRISRKVTVKRDPSQPFPRMSHNAGGERFRT